MKSMTIMLVPEEVAARLLQKKDFLIKVEGWSRKRKLHLRGENLILEVAMKDCMCSTCVRRFESLIFSMRERNVEYEVGSWSGDCSIKFISPVGFEETEICNFLSERIELAVSGIEEVQIEKSEA